MSQNTLLFHMDEASGDLSESSGSSGLATCSGSQCPTYQASGVFKQSMTFSSASQQYLTLDSTALARIPSGSSSFSTCTWAKLTSASYYSWVFVAGGGNGYTNAMFAIGTGANGTSLASSGLEISNFWKPGVWNHVCQVYDNSTQISYLYANGGLIGQNSSAVSLVPTKAHIDCGHYFGSPSEYWNGSIDEVAFWTRTLTTSEVKNLYNRGAYRLKAKGRICTSTSCTGSQFIGNDFDLDLTLSQGSIPLIQSSSQPKQQLRAYVFNYFKEEIQAEALVKDIPSFARFLKVASLLNAQELNLSSVSRDAGVKRATVENYFSILEDTLLGFILRPFEPGIRIKERRHPKFYWLDAGVVRAIREEWGPITASEKGPLFESYILTLLRAYQSYLDAFDEISYWATPNVEVDFVIKKNSKYYAIEVKSSERFRPEDLSGLKSLSDLKNLRKRILVYPKMETQQTDDGILILGFDEFNRRLEDQSLFV